MTATITGPATRRFTEDWCLRHCEGYRVEVDGVLLGYVEEVVVGPDEVLARSGPVLELVVGPPASRSVPSADVLHVDGTRQLVVVAPPA
ncbi:MAG TPA: hypothetical protein VLB86_14920 [Gaiellaceae bacterium]|nr:hypothetical protein [Gaiellaceae bacterium]